MICATSEFKFASFYFKSAVNGSNLRTSNSFGGETKPTKSLRQTGTVMLTIVVQFYAHQNIHN